MLMGWDCRCQVLSLVSEDIGGLEFRVRIELAPGGPCGGRCYGRQGGGRVQRSVMGVTCSLLRRSVFSCVCLFQPRAAASDISSTAPAAMPAAAAATAATAAVIAAAAAAAATTTSTLSPTPTSTPPATAAGMPLQLQRRHSTTCEIHTIATTASTFSTNGTTTTALVRRSCCPTIQSTAA